MCGPETVALRPSYPSLSSNSAVGLMPIGCLSQALKKAGLQQVSADEILWKENRGKEEGRGKLDCSYLPSLAEWVLHQQLSLLSASILEALDRPRGFQLLLNVQSPRLYSNLLFPYSL